MNRFPAVAMATMIAAGVAAAGPIQIGGVNGLTGSYITSGCSTNITGQTCIGGSVGSFVEQSYDVRLFQNATENGTSPTPYAGYNILQASTGTLTGTGTFDTGTKFSMINDGCGNTPGGACTGGAVSNNFWDGEGTTSMIIPIGIKDVTDVYTVLDNIWGAAGANDTNVTFTFGSTANATAGTTVVTVNLTNSSNTGTASGQIGTSIDCTVVQNAFCNTFAPSPLAPTTVVTPTVTGTSIGAIGVTVHTDSVVNTPYNGGAIARFNGSQGTLSIDDQQFVFSNPQLAGLYLVSIGVQELNGAPQLSQTALSAITVDSPIPEPSTILLVLSGLGSLGLMTRLRRRA